jgi:hypothetical protein
MKDEKNVYSDFQSFKIFKFYLLPCDPSQSGKAANHLRMYVSLKIRHFETKQKRFKNRIFGLKFFYVCSKMNIEKE